MKKVLKVIFYVSFLFYLIVLVSLLFLGSRGFFGSDLSLIEYIYNSSNFIPFKTISIYITAMFNGSMNLDIPIKNLFGNFMMFLPMGIFLPYFTKKLNKWSRFIIFMIIVLFVIEVLQVVTRLGSFDIDDFILNMVGALIGFGIWNTKFVKMLNK